MAGHHADSTLLVVDEASGVEDEVYNQAIGWAHRVLAFGNPNPTHNFWAKGIKQGDINIDDLHRIKQQQEAQQRSNMNETT